MKKNRLQPTLVTPAHSYTRSSEPWQVDGCAESDGDASSDKVKGWKLFHYMSGGGMKSFGRTLQQDIRERRQNRFLFVAGALAVVWICLLVF